MTFRMIRPQNATICRVLPPKNGAIIFTTVLLPFYYHEIAENSVNTVPFAAFCRDLPRFIHKNLRNAKGAVADKKHPCHSCYPPQMP